MTAQSSFDALSGIKKMPVKVTYSRKAWPLLIFDLTVRTIGSLPTVRRALLLGITYQSTPWAGTPHALTQPRHDVQLMKKYLVESAKWSESDITVLTDARGTPDRLLPTYANIMREIMLLGKSNCRNVFLYTGHSDQRRQPKQTSVSSNVPKSVPGRRVVEEFDQYIVPIDAVIGPKLTDIAQNLVVLDDDLHDCLISTLPALSTFLAVLDTCHSATLLDLAHDRCNRTGTVKSILRNSIRRVIVEPFSKLSRRFDRGLADVGSFNVSDFCNGFCPRQKTPIYPVAVTIAACKDHQQVYENGPSLTETIVQVLESNPKAELRDITDAVLVNYKNQQKQMRTREKELMQEGDAEGVQDMQQKRLQASRLMPQVASTSALHLSRSHSSSGVR